MYQAHYRSIVRIAALLAGDVQAAEDIAQDSFVAMHGSWSRLRDYDKGLSFLLQFVVSRSRLIPRQPPVAGPVAGPGTPEQPPDVPSTGPAGRPLVGSAFRALPQRQREALVLGFYLDLPDGQIAAAMRISRGAVKVHTVRGIAAMRGNLPT
jgi:DNA-directed RNA polymerase specialized sigma24 family protein